MQAAMHFDTFMTRRIAAPARVHGATEADAALVRRTFDKYRSPNCKDGTPPSWCIFAQKPRTRPQSENHH
jgi:hypothetical protein